MLKICRRGLNPSLSSAIFRPLSLKPSPRLHLSPITRPKPSPTPAHSHTTPLELPSQLHLRHIAPLKPTLYLHPRRIKHSQTSTNTSTQPNQLQKPAMPSSTQPCTTPEVLTTPATQRIVKFCKDFDVWLTLGIAWFYWIIDRLNRWSPVIVST